MIDIEIAFYGYNVISTEYRLCSNVMYPLGSALLHVISSVFFTAMLQSREFSQINNTVIVAKSGLRWPHSPMV